MEKSEPINIQPNITETESDLEKLPKSKFELIDIDRETELFYSFTKRGRFSFVFDKFFPELVAIQKECEDKEECIKKFKEFLEDLSAKTKGKMLASKEELESEWDKIGPEFLEALSKHFETEWPKDKPEIVGLITNLPVYPRFLDNYKFGVGYENIPKSIETSAHEIVHFLWFKKWKEVFPEMGRREYESPRLAWRLSEIMDPIILQCHPKIKELIKPKGWGYSSFKDIKIGDVSMTEYFKKIYLDSVGAGDNFETTLKNLWSEAQKHEKEISKF
ncbi:MAG: hypothetical protein AAB837_00430 [Patescibacteria group bacterium]